MNSTIRPALTLALLLSLPAASHASELTLPETREHLTEPRHLKVAKATPANQTPADTAPATAHTLHPAQPSDLPSQSNAADLNNSEFKTQNSKLKTSPSPLAQANETEAQPSHRLPPRVGVGYNGAGYEGTDSFGRLEGFVPLRQNPGRDVTFLEGRMLLDNDANLGANAVLGHRAYNQSDNRIYGGYLAYDSRNTGQKFFQQLGLGFESLGEIWDIRSNAYIPIGDVRQQTDVAISDTGLLVTDTRFSGHNLLFDTFRQRSESRVHEAAVFSFDVEGGGRIAKLGKRGDLRLYGGPYYYSAPEGDSVVGWRTRLVARPNPYWNLSLGFQTDGLFGTNLLFQVGAAFPSSRPKGLNEEDDSKATVLARMGEFVERNPSILIDQQVSSSFFQESLTITANNPATGEPWFFNHVNLGLGNSDGSFESPFGTVAEALATIPTDGNGIVYVAQGTNPGIPAFTIPNNVQVLSRGPVQTIPVVTTLQSQRDPIVSTTITSPVQLPFSGSGNFPLVTDTATLGNDSVLSGFTITPPTGSVGVLGSSVRNVEIRDNRISTTGDDAAGIRLSNPGGTATITNNRIATTGNTTNTTFGNANFLVNGAHGIELDLSNATLDSAAISGNTVTTEGNYAAGILANVRNGGVLTAATVSGNTVSTTGVGAEGIHSHARSTGGSATIGAATVSGNTVSTTGNFAEGISSRAFSNGGNTTIGAATVSGNTVSTTGGNTNGIYSGASGSNGGSATIGAATVSGNTVSTTGDGTEGIYSHAYSNGGSATIGTATISGNTVSTTGLFVTHGIFSLAYSNGGSATIGAATISGNTVSTTEDNAKGIYSHAYSNGGSATIGAATISGNTVSTTGEYAHGIFSRAYSDGGSATIGTATISGNTVSTTGDSAYGIFSRAYSFGGSATIGTATISGNTVSTMGGYAYGIFSRADNAGGSASLCAVLSGNVVTVTTQQANADAFRFNRTGVGATFQIVDTAGTFPTTQATNTANPLGGGTAFNFVGGTGNFTQVTSCP